MLLAAIIAVFIGAFLVAAWYLFHSQIAAATIRLQHGLMMAAGAFTGRYESLDAQVLAADPAAVRFGALWRLLHNVGTFYRYPAAALIALPPGAWRYGRVIAVAESPLANRKDRPKVRRNVEAAIQLLNDLGIVVEEWPTR